MKPRFASLALALAVLAVVAFVTLGNRAHDGAPLISAPAPAAAAATPQPPTQLVSLPSGHIANGTSPLKVVLSAPVSPTAPTPALNPSVAGSWSIDGDALVFTPASTLEPCGGYALTIWSRTASTGHAQLGRKRTIHLSVACPPLEGLQQALARLGYLGARFRPLYDVHYPAGRETRRAAAEHAFHPPRGMLAPYPSSAPPARMGELDATTRGAIEIFQGENGLPVTGEPSHAMWLKVLFDLTVVKRNPQPYTWVSVSESSPESLQLHRGTHVVFTTAVNTGVAGAETQQGIFPIYSRLTSTTMSGTDPDGTKYSVPDVPWVNYFNGGDAVHGYPRASYGFPQSNGCVELPIEAAQHIYPMLAIGDIVWVR